MKTNKKVTKKEIIKEIARDSKELVGNALRGVCELGFALSSPILGNLSENLQNKIENLTDGLYNPRMSRGVSYVSNTIGYGILGGYCGNSIASTSLEESFLTPLGFFIGVGLGVAESTIREDIIEHSRRGVYPVDTVASLPGKVVSLPFDLAYYASGKIKEYLNDVTSRIERKKGLEEKIEREK